MGFVKFRCAICGREYPVHDKIFRCDCGGFLEIDGALPFEKSDLKDRGAGIWRYRRAFGLPHDTVPVSMGEGNTPLVERRFEKTPVLLKMDFLQPSGSFKDRGASVLLSYISYLGITAVCEDSSGNAGASLSAYAAAAGLQCTIYVPEYTPIGKITQIRMYGAEVVQVPGKRQDANEAVLKDLSGCFYASHLWHPYFVMGLKSAAYEIWEDTGGFIPDTVIVPVGSGGFLEGLFAGFESLFCAGYATRVPKIIGVQAAACTPIHSAFIQDSDELAEVCVGETIAEGIVVQRPPRAKAVLDAIRKSGGYTVAVEDKEILDAVQRLSGSGVYVEPTSASTLAAWMKIEKEDRENTVLILTGSGLKTTEKYYSLLRG